MDDRLIIIKYTRPNIHNSIHCTLLYTSLYNTSVPLLLLLPLRCVIFKIPTEDYAIDATTRVKRSGVAACSFTVIFANVMFSCFLSNAGFIKSEQNNSVQQEEVHLLHVLLYYYLQMLVALLPSIARFSKICVYTYL